MAERRMFSRAIIGSGRFLQMPPSTRLLYYDLGMSADDDGVVEAFSVMRLTGATEDDLKVLAAKGFIRVLNEEMVSYITDWKVNNYIRGDRYQPSIYKPLLVSMGELEERSTNGTPTVDQRSTQYRIDKNRLDKIRIEEDRIEEEEDSLPAPDPLVAFAADNLIGMNADLADELTSYRDNMQDDVIRWAINEALANGSRAFSYVRKVLNRCVESGYQTLAEVKAAQEARAKQTAKAEPAKYEKPKKPMDTRSVTDNDFDKGYYADIMSRPRSRREEG